MTNQKLNQKLIYSGLYTGGGVSILSNEGLQNFEKVYSSVLPRYSDDKVEQMCRKIEKCQGFYLSPLSTFGKLKRSDLGLIQDQKGDTSISETLQAMVDVLENDSQNINSQITNGHFETCDQTLTTLQNIIKAAQALQSSAQQLKNRTEKLKELEEGKKSKIEEERKGKQSFAGIYSDKSLKYTIYGDNGKETKFHNPSNLKNRSQHNLIESPTESKIERVRQESDERVSYLQSIQDLLSMVQDLGDYNLEQRHINDLKGTSKAETELFQILGPKYLKMKIALSKLLIRSAKEIQECSNTDEFPKLEEFKACNEYGCLTTVRSSFKKIIYDENLWQSLITNKIKNPLEAGGFIAIERVGRQLDIVTAQLNGESLEQFLKYEDGSYMSYQEISEELGISKERFGTPLAETALRYISNYVEKQNIELPQPQQTTNIARK